MSRFFLLYLVVMMAGCSGTRPTSIGVTGGRLPACPASPNCVSSQSPDKEHAVEPLRYKGTAEQAKRLLIEALLGMKRVRIVRPRSATSTRSSPPPYSASWTMWSFFWTTGRKRSTSDRRPASATPILA
jgi:hypothetical protein